MNKKQILVIILIIICLFCLIFLIKNTINDISDNKTLSVKEINSENEITKLQKIYNNKEIVGKIIIPNTEINEIVLQSKDNNYYLNHDTNKNKNLVGSIFVDYRVKFNNDQKNIIYGHNSKTLETPFKELEKYYSYNYYKEHKYIYLIDNSYICKYKIFSVFVEAQDWTYLNINIPKEQWVDHLLKLKSKSFYNININLTNQDNILILQTCSFHNQFKKYKNKYLIIVAKKIDKSKVN